MKKFMIASLLLAGCKEDGRGIAFSEIQSASCLKFETVPNPDCVAGHWFFPKAYAAPISSTAAMMAASSSGANAARIARERRRKAESCSKSPLVNVCTEFKVTGGYVSHGQLDEKLKESK